MNGNNKLKPFWFQNYTDWNVNKAVKLDQDKKDPTV